eukprot:CAMPEP_0194602774 /NCGR_PEP_ID=MMETSP0292-20121207/29857_1 /TAXON_ID=39354 /ORGANISM="Heterosigma akashiwo, Strain CCMP2393" /LENGTH=102 /DNA_ID=CAMNT_0039465095 /DNA_START=924 /DNA_END=1233 /DNA_ORIENTATION=+
MPHYRPTPGGHQNAAATRSPAAGGLPAAAGHALRVPPQQQVPEAGHRRGVLQAGVVNASVVFVGCSASVGICVFAHNILNNWLPVAYPPVLTTCNYIETMIQ